VTTYPDITLDDLPRYSPWPGRLLAPDPHPVAQKTEAEVMREFDRDKWGELLERGREDLSFGLSAAESYEGDPDLTLPLYDRGRLSVVPLRYARDRAVEVYASVLGEYASEASALVELGAGYGSKLLRLAAMPSFANLPLYAAELTPRGRELIALLAQRERREVTVGACNFRDATLSLGDVAPGALVFTSFAAHYVPELSMQFVESIARLKPAVVVHFEPCIEHFESDTLHDLLCRSYMLRNDYNRNLAGLLELAAKNNKISVSRVERKVFGLNPLLPMSVIAWSPRA
jgi:hypothetical protein